MKQIFIIRHAKSSWSQAGIKDIQRPLNNRGKHDAPKMAKWLFENLATPIEKIYSSPAKRAHTTAKHFHEEFGLDSELELWRDIYYGDEDDILQIINNSANRFNSVALFGHNPMLTNLVNQFIDNFLDNLPTCGITHLSSTSETWSDVKLINTKLENFYFPKQLIY